MRHPAASVRAPQRLIRPIVRKLQAYVPGEQPKIKGLIKLNTNENPYGPAPEVLAALRHAVHEGLRLYPNPTADRLRQKLAKLHRCAPENLIVGNGSDELLALATRAFVEPLTGLTQFALHSATLERAERSKVKRQLPRSSELTQHLARSRYTVQYFEPSYSLYPVLAAMHGAWPKAVPLANDFTLPSVAELKENGWDFEAALTYITTPNAPSGRAFSRAQLEDLCRAHEGLLVLDEAYVDFAEEHVLDLALKYPHVLVARTFSKAYSLCALRVGYFVGHPDLIAALQKIRDSYNVNGLGQVAAETTLDCLPYYRKCFRRIIASRQQLSDELTNLGFEVVPSQTNFILVRPPGPPAKDWLRHLRERKILVRWFSHPETNRFLRITIGCESEVAQLLRAVRGLLGTRGRTRSRK